MDTFRKEYKPLSDEQKKQVNEIKVKAEELLELMNQAVPAEAGDGRSRCMALARTNLEQTIMWAVKGITA